MLNKKNWIVSTIDFYFIETRKKNSCYNVQFGKMNDFPEHSKSRIVFNFQESSNFTQWAMKLVKGVKI